ncbi:MAG: outer membrane receptor for ferrienterochelin and colicins [Planctomycetota bacterium]|jgi:outer membrane receptor for ferrienterochelin and colicins
MLLLFGYTRVTHAAALLLVGLVLVHPLQAQDDEEVLLEEPDFTELSLDELMSIEIDTVYGASKHEQTVNEAPASVTVIKREDIVRFGYRTLGEVLAGVRSFGVRDDRNYAVPGVRGFSLPEDVNPRVLVLVDGHRINNDLFGAAAMDRSFVLDLALVERIEIVRGPGSALYGSNAFFAVIDVITRRGESLDGFEVQAGGGKHGSTDARVTWGQGPEDGTEVLLSASFYDSSGENLRYGEFSDTASGGFTSDTDYENSMHLFARVATGPWSLDASHVQREKGIPTGSFGTVFDDPDSRTLDTQTSASLSWKPETEGEWSYRASLSYRRYIFDGDYVVDYEEEGVPPFTLNQDEGIGESIDLELQSSYTGFEDQRWTVGADIRRQFTLDQKNFDDDVYLDDERSDTISGVYVQEEISLGEDTTLSLGLRHDEYESFGGSTNPRIAFVHEPWEGTTWKFLAGRAFRAPNAAELYYNDGDDTAKANPDLDPETIETYEAVWEEQFSSELRGSMSIFFYKIEDLIEQVEDPADDLLVFENREHVDAEGVEFEIEKVWQNGWRAQFAPTWQLVRVQGETERMPGSPRHSANLSLVGPVLGDTTTLALEAAYLGERPTLAGDTTDDAFLLHATLVKTNIADGIDLSLGLRNLLDESYSDPGGGEHEQDQLARQGRTWFIRLTASF